MYVPIKKNVCCGIPYGHRSAPVLHLPRGGVTGVMCWHGSNFNFLCHKALPGCHSLGLREEKWVPLLINELVKYQPISQRGAGYKDSTPKWIGNRPPKYGKCKHVPLSLAPQNREINSTIQARSSINKSKWRFQPIGSKIRVTKINHRQ